MLLLLVKIRIVTHTQNPTQHLLQLFLHQIQCNSQSVVLFTVYQINFYHFWHFFFTKVCKKKQILFSHSFHDFWTNSQSFLNIHMLKTTCEFKSTWVCHKEWITATSNNKSLCFQIALKPGLSLVLPWEVISFPVLNHEINKHFISKFRVRLLY